MATFGNLLNPQGRASNEPSATGTLADILFKRAEEERQLKMKMQYEKALADQEQSIIDEGNKRNFELIRSGLLKNINNTKDAGEILNKSLYAKGNAIANNPDKHGVTIIKSKNAPSNAMMSMPDGSFGDISGNVIPQQEEVVQPSRTVIPSQSDIGFGIDVDSKGRTRIIPKMNNDDIEKYQFEAVKIGIDPKGLNKDELSKLIAQENIRQKEVDNIKKLKERPPTQGQETTALYASRLKQANEVFDNLEEYTKSLTPVMYDLNAGLPDFLNFMKSGDLQSYQQAQRNFLNAVLRRESGAVISPSEISEGRRQYFPQPGDKPETLLQKKANRELVMNNFIKASGNAYTPYDESSNSSMNNNDIQSVQTQNNLTFNSVQEAEAANLPKGTIVSINGRQARID